MIIIIFIGIITTGFILSAACIYRKCKSRNTPHNIPYNSQEPHYQSLDSLLYSEDTEENIYTVV